MMRALGVTLLFIVVAAWTSSASDVPLVSVIIPTYDRSEFLSQALKLIGRQDYPNLEVIIVDDSEKAEDVPKEIAGIPIKYLHLDLRVTIGEKRNIAVLHAKGEVIVHWDDDDYFRPHRVSTQVRPILSGETDMTVLEHHYYFHLPTKTFYTVKRPSSWGPHFATFAYRRSIYESGVRYPDNSMAEDYAFAEFALERGYSIRVINNEDGKHIYLRHQNTWEFDFADYENQVHAVEQPSFFSQEDFDFYSTIKPHPTSKPPNHFSSDRVKWNRRELHPTVTGEGLNYPPYYPAYTINPSGGLSTAAKIGIGVGVASGVVIIVGVGIAAYFFFQWRKTSHNYIRINEDGV